LQSAVDRNDKRGTDLLHPLITQPAKTIGQSA